MQHYALHQWQRCILDCRSRYIHASPFRLRGSLPAGIFVRGIGNRVIGRLRTPKTPVGAGDISGLQQVTVDELCFGFPAFGAGRGIEQPVFKLNLNWLGPGRIDAEFLPELLDGSPVAQ